MSTSTSSVSEPAGAGDVPTTIVFESVSLRFRNYGDSAPTLKQAVLNRVLRRRYKVNQDFWLYRDLNLRIEHGCRLGIVGRNGAGKSTLLKMMCGIYRPTQGRIAVHGRLAPLIELGAGMLGELSGEQNIYLNGALLGFSHREMKAKVERILEFAGLLEFRDMPLKYYSSGMTMRLAFSVATDVDPEVLLIDEVFAGGDADFINKARDRMKRLLDDSDVVVMVSHQMELISQMCNRALWIDKGQVMADGGPDQVTKAYLASIS